MSAMESRTHEALHQVAGALVLSEEDMDHLEEDLMTLLERADAPQRRLGVSRPWWDWAVAATAVVALVVGALALWRADHPSTPPAGPPSTRTSGLMAPELIGLWHTVGGTWIWEFASDGRFGYVDNSSAYLRKEALQITTTERRGDLYTVSELENGTTCVSEFWLRTTGPDRAVMTVRRSQCHAENVGSELEFERVSPRIRSSAPLAPALQPEAARTVTSILDLFGTWVEPATGMVLSVGDHREGDELAAYLLDDDGDGSVSPDRTGRLVLAGDGSLADERTTSGSCAPVFTKARTDKATLTTTSGSGGCFPAGTVQTWLRISN